MLLSYLHAPQGTIKNSPPKSLQAAWSSILHALGHLIFTPTTEVTHVPPKIAASLNHSKSCSLASTYRFDMKETVLLVCALWRTGFVSVENVMWKNTQECRYQTELNPLMCILFHSIYRCDCQDFWLLKPAYVIQRWWAFLFHLKHI